MIIILMGVSGAGKTTVGRILAGRLQWPFFDGDDLHSVKNVEKMRQGIPLDDADREPWLKSLRALIKDLVEENRSAVIACSSLKKSYREFLRHNNQVTFIYLKGDAGLLSQRLASRQDHYMSPSLLASQLETLEEPQGSLIIDAAIDPGIIADLIIEKLGEAK